MHRYLPGILLIQLISIAIFWVNLDVAVSWNITLLLKIGLPIVVLGTTTALWFDSIGRSRAADTISKLKDSHAREREKLHIKTEQEKSKVIKEAHKEINKQARQVSGKANFKVGLAFMGAAGAGFLLLLIELVTFGMMTIMTAGGALGGYLFRAKRETTPYANALPANNQPRVVNQQDDDIVRTIDPMRGKPGPSGRGQERGRQRRP